MQKGFTYLALLIAVAAGGAVLAAVGELVSHSQLREKEAELLFVGHEYRNAIAAYYERSPGGAKRYPQSLEELLQDKRYQSTQRYLRKLYPDPLGGGALGLVEAPGGGIMGVYSQAEARPLKSAGFDKVDAAFKDAEHYTDWKFSYSPPGPSASSPGSAQK